MKQKIKFFYHKKDGKLRLKHVGPKIIKFTSRRFLNRNNNLPTEWIPTIICVHNYKESTLQQTLKGDLTRNSFRDEHKTNRGFASFLSKQRWDLQIRVLDLSEACQPINSYDPIYPALDDKEMGTLFSTKSDQQAIKPTATFINTHPCGAIQMIHLSRLFLLEA